MMDAQESMELLSSASAQGGKITGLTLTGLNLDGARLSGISFIGCSLEGSFRDTGFSRCSFEGGSLMKWDLTGASFDGCLFRGDIFQEATLERSIFVKCRLEVPESRGPNLKKTYFNGCSFDALLALHSADLVSAVFMDCAFGQFTAEESILEFCAFRNCSFAGLRILKSSCSGMQLMGLTIPAFAAEASELPQAIFMDSSLKGARFSGCVLDGATFTGADLSGAVFDGCSAPKANFAGASMRASDLAGLSAPYADFSRCDFFGARCAGADLSSVNLHRATGIDPRAPGMKAEGARLTDPALAKAEDFRPFMRG
ncbi:MAG: pentapeptide repeat-containing protein [Deltaproteobacteria bacterium]|jgi:uncharacterized protein YjbI with pentapeptide repeats|nr:pentapeptide repeat-containing protein [Deltaproteobacteria bacterium]